MGDCMKLVKAIFAFLLPPVAVALHRGCCNCDFLINVLLTLLGYVPGLIHAIYVLMQKDEEDMKLPK